MNRAISLISILQLIIPSMYGQLALNLDFEKKSIEGAARPWGWEIGVYGGSHIFMDSLEKHNGNYSLNFYPSSDDNTTYQELAFYLEPYELLGAKVVIEGQSKKNNEDDLALIVLQYFLENDTILYEIESTLLSKTNGWTKLGIEIQLPKNTTIVRILLKYQGKESAWFDHLMLCVNGQEKLELEIAPPFTEHQKKWLFKNTFPIDRIDPNGGKYAPNFDDLSNLKKVIGNSRIIALGESTHGTSEFFRFKNRMLEYCVFQLGVRMFAIEDNQLVVNRVNKYVLGGSGTARSSMYGMLGVWQTLEVHNLIEWIRNFNDSHPTDKVEFVGFDVQNVTVPLDSVLSFAGKKSAKLLNEVSLLLANLKENHSQAYIASDSVKNSWFINAEKVLGLFENNSSDWLQKANNREDSLNAYYGVQYARLVKQFAENSFRGHSTLYRDIAMAENVTWLINVYKPGSKVMIWAHDVHISKGEHSNPDANIYYGKSMGAHLARKHGNNYKAFGLFSYQGEYSCYVSYSNFKVTDCPLYSSPRGTLDYELHNVSLKKKSPALILDLKNARSIDWISDSMPFRFANHVNIEYGYWTRYSLPYQFDAIFFIDTTTSAKSYARSETK